ncbi:MAG: acyl-CoA carboxylase subunit beta [Alphaproteobacteria bacterium]
MARERQFKEFEARRAAALAMGGPEKVARQRSLGRLTVRERVDRLCDAGSFAETGLFAASFRPEMRDRTPADGLVTGIGRIDGRDVAISAGDATVLGASNSRVQVVKNHKLIKLAEHVGIPLVFLSENGGGRLPDAMGAEGMAGLGRQVDYRRTRQSPWVSAVLGQCFGNAAFQACISEYVVMRRDAVMAVASPRVTAVAVSEKSTGTAVGSADMHLEETGFVDHAVDGDEEALDHVRRFLSYLPSNAGQMPPTAPVPAGADVVAGRVLDLVPEDRTRVYDMRKVVEAIFDPGSVFVLRERFGRALLTALARLDGRTVGIVANNPLIKGGAMDAAGCDKAMRFLIMCDSFNIPLIFMADTPGFLIGEAAERQRVAGKIMNFQQAMEFATVPKLALILRKSYGQAWLSMGGLHGDDIAAWYTAEVGFVDPAVGVSVVYGLTREQDPERWEQLRAELARGTSAYDLAAPFYADRIIDPRDTRAHLIRQLDIHQRRRTSGIGERRLANWPSTY